jgi:tRNA(Ile)-lysidine synthetase-like protein
MGKSLSEDNELIERIAKKELDSRLNDDGSLCLKDFSALHTSVAVRLIKFYCERSGATELSNSHLKQMYHICVSGGEAQLPKCSFLSSNGKLFKKENKTFKKTFSVEIKPDSIEEFLNIQKINNLLLKNYIDCDKIVGKLVVRTRQSGDSIRLKNKNGTKPLTNLYNEYHIDNQIRENLPVISDDKGVVFVYKIGVAERAAADSNSKNILKISVFEGEEEI